tara:strand:- start:64 stop:522 length:459 start_codon:yes stop_codon:yes gene_type:complete
MFKKIAKSLKGFVKSDIGKIAIGVGSTFLLPGMGPAAAASGTSLGGQILGGAKTLFGAAKAKASTTGLLGLKGKIEAAQGIMGAVGGLGGGGGTSYGGGSTGYSSLASEGLTTYSPEGAQTVQAPAAADFSAFMNESIALYNYAESQGRKTT